MIALSIDSKLFLIKHIEKMIKEQENSCEPVENILALKGALICVCNTATVEKMKNETNFVIIKDA